jgi:hypothetical protein
MRGNPYGADGTARAGQEIATVKIGDHE